MPGMAGKKSRKKAKVVVRVRGASRSTKFAKKLNERDAEYRAALGLGNGGDLPKALGTSDGHGGAQPQVGSRSRGTRKVPSNRATPRPKPKG
jgi:hypothetical protein